MGGSVVPIATGPATQISGSNLQDTTLYNMSTTSAVWVGNSQSVAPNTGMRIGPLGTARWAKTSGLAWVCVDTGVSAPININVSNDVSDTANPVDVATATAIAVFSQGVPPVDAPLSLTPPIWTGAGSPPAVNFFDVTHYNSLVLDLYPTNRGANQAVKDINSVVIWMTAPGMAVPVVVDVITNHSNGRIHVEMPVVGTQMAIQFLNSINTSGTNYTLADGSSYVLSYHQRTPQVVVNNYYWETTYETNFGIISGADVGNAYGSLSLTNNTTSVYPSYRRGPQSVGLLLVNTGSAGSTFELAVQDALSGFWLAGFVTQPATTSPTFNQETCNLSRQPSVFMRTSSTAAQTFQYTQVAAA